jgi:hypothetical protein
MTLHIATLNERKYCSDNGDKLIMFLYSDFMAAVLNFYLFNNSNST